jgi:hypothetical protein
MNCAARSSFDARGVELRALQKLLAEAMPLFRSDQKNVRRLLGGIRGCRDCGNSFEVARILSFFSHGSQLRMVGAAPQVAIVARMDARSLMWS